MNHVLSSLSRPQFRSGTLSFVIKTGYSLRYSFIFHAKCVKLSQSFENFTLYFAILIVIQQRNEHFPLKATSWLSSVMYILKLYNIGKFFTHLSQNSFIATNLSICRCIGHVFQSAYRKKARYHFQFFKEHSGFENIPSSYNIKSFFVDS